METRFSATPPDSDRFPRGGLARGESQFGRRWLWLPTLVMILLSGVAFWPLCICLSDYSGWRMSAGELIAASAVFLPFALFPVVGYVQSLRAGTMSKYLQRIAVAVVVLAAINAVVVFARKPARSARCLS